MKIPNLITHQIKILYGLYEKNMSKIVFLILMHMVSAYLVGLPYINIFTGEYFPFMLDWIVFLLLFHPPKGMILKMGLFLLIITVIFAVLRLKPIEELLGEISFVAIATFVILSLKEENI